MFGKVRLSCGIGLALALGAQMSSAPRRRSSSVNMAVLLSARASTHCRPCVGMLFDRWTRQHRFARLHHVHVVERVPGRGTSGSVGCGSSWRMKSPIRALVTPNCTSRVDVGVVRVVDLRDQDLEPWLDDQRVKMRGAIGVPVLRLEEPADDAVGRNRIPDHLDRAEPEAPVRIGRELAAQVDTRPARDLGSRRGRSARRARYRPPRRRSAGPPDPARAR